MQNRKFDIDTELFGEHFRLEGEMDGEDGGVVNMRVSILIIPPEELKPDEELEYFNYLSDEFLNETAKYVDRPRTPGWTSLRRYFEDAACQWCAKNPPEIIEPE